MSTATPSTHVSAAEPDAAAAAETIAAAESEIAATAQAIAALRKKLKTLRARRTGREGEGALEEQLRAQLKRRALAQQRLRYHRDPAKKRKKAEDPEFKRKKATRRQGTPPSRGRRTRGRPHPAATAGGQ